MRKLSELEGVSLGVVSNYQPCTAYSVRRELKNSPSSHWQASAGSVYPLLARLEAEGLVATKADKSDGRGRRLLTVTARGRKVLKAWIMDGADEVLISSVTDPLRSRMFFLGVLSASKQSEYLNKLIALMEGHLAEITADLDSKSEHDDLYDYLGALGAVRVAETRLDWLRVVRKRLSKTEK